MEENDFIKLVSDYDNIIFDYGGIFIDIDYKKTISELKALSSDYRDIFSQQNQIEIFSKFERGEVSSKQFVETLMIELKVDASYNEVVNAWNAMLYDIPSQRINLLQKLRENKKTFLLSNINELHEQFVLDYLDRNDTDIFYNSFDEIYFSHHIGMRKPDADIFKFVIEQNGLDIAKSLFIDDSIQHVEGARAVGLNSLHINSNTFIVDGIKV